MGAIGDAVRRAFAAGSSLALARAQLASAELEQAWDAWLRWLLAGLMACLLAALGLLAVATALALALWERFGWLAVALLGLVFLLGAAIVLMRLRRDIASAPRLFSMTLAELAKDRAAILGAARAASQDRAAEEELAEDELDDEGGNRQEEKA